MNFARFVGIDYSGAATPEARLPGLAVWMATPDAPAQPVDPGRRGRWSRVDLAAWLQRTLVPGAPRTLVGIDHGLSFPLDHFRRHALADWDAFLDDFVRHWPTAEPGRTVESLRAGNPRPGDARELRECERWTNGALSVFHFDVQGSPAKSTHAGLPWIRALRRDPALAGGIHFWPYDGFAPGAVHHVVAEAWPSLYRRRFARGNRSADQHDAASLADAFADAQRRGSLDRWFDPPLSDAERADARREGWILGVT